MAASAVGQSPFCEIGNTRPGNPSLEKSTNLQSALEYVAADQRYDIVRDHILTFYEEIQTIPLEEDGAIEVASITDAGDRMPSNLADINRFIDLYANADLVGNDVFLLEEKEKLTLLQEALPLMANEQSWNERDNDRKLFLISAITGGFSTLYTFNSDFMVHSGFDDMFFTLNQKLDTLLLESERLYFPLGVTFDIRVCTA